MIGVMDGVRIVEFDEIFAEDFARLNYEWINEYFVVEEPDREMLDDPGSCIIGRGGQIFFALVNNAVAGTVALIHEEPDRFELAKMAVSPALRGRGIGDMLIEACVEYGVARGKRALFLLSNTKLGPAINLYRKHGFVETPLDAEAPYQRVNIRMELALNRCNR
jgi:putative acetyltransferase